MRKSGYVWREAYEGSAAFGHTREGKPEEVRRLSQANAAASLYSTAEEYARFLLVLFRPRAGDSSLLEGEATAEMLKPHVSVEEGISWGLGWPLEKTPAGTFFWHWGDNGEFKGFVIGSLRDGAAVVVLTNSANGMKVCRPIVEKIFGRDHPALSFRLVDY
jgi:CubicO group peptidase (beta-lactamase class C family)